MALDAQDEAQARPDFCRGQTTVLPMRDVFRVLRAVTSALAATHRLGFVHQGEFEFACLNAEQAARAFVSCAAAAAGTRAVACMVLGSGNAT